MREVDKPTTSHLATIDFLLTIPKWLKIEAFFPPNALLQYDANGVEKAEDRNVQKRSIASEYNISIVYKYLAQRPPQLTLESISSSQTTATNKDPKH